MVRRLRRRHVRLQRYKRTRDDAIERELVSFPRYARLAQLSPARLDDRQKDIAHVVRRPIVHELTFDRICRDGS
jgi:hypothetical protein